MVHCGIHLPLSAPRDSCGLSELCVDISQTWDTLAYYLVVHGKHLLVLKSSRVGIGAHLMSLILSSCDTRPFESAQFRRKGHKDASCQTDVTMSFYVSKALSLLSTLCISIISVQLTWQLFRHKHPSCPGAESKNWNCDFCLSKTCNTVEHSSKENLFYYFRKNPTFSAETGFELKMWYFFLT